MSEKRSFVGVIRVQDGREDYEVRARSEAAARRKIAKVYRVGESMVLSCSEKGAAPIIPNFCPKCGHRL